MSKLGAVIESVEKHEKFVLEQVKRARSDEKFGREMTERWEKIKAGIQISRAPTGLPLPRLALQGLDNLQFIPTPTDDMEAFSIRRGNEVLGIQKGNFREPSCRLGKVEAGQHRPGRDIPQPQLAISSRRSVDACSHEMPAIRRECQRQHDPIATRQQAHATCG